MNSTTYTFLSFEEWKKENPDIESPDEDCKQCMGSGEHECECGDAHTCNACDGSGSEGDGLLGVYRLQLRKDKSLLESYRKQYERLENDKTTS